MTLLELVCAAVMVSLALVGTAGAVVSATAMQETTTRKRAAARRAASLLADLRASDMATLVADHHDTERQLDTGSGKLATARISVTAVAGTTTAAPVYRIEVRVAYEGGAGSDELTFVTHACDHSDISVGGSSPAGVVPPDGLMLDWVTDIENKILAGQSTLVTYQTVELDDTDAMIVDSAGELDDSDVVYLAPDTGLVEPTGETDWVSDTDGTTTESVLLYHSLPHDQVPTYDALETQVAPDYNQ